MRTIADFVDLGDGVASSFELGRGPCRDVVFFALMQDENGRMPARTRETALDVDHATAWGSWAVRMWDDFDVSHDASNVRPRPGRQPSRFPRCFPVECCRSERAKRSAKRCIS